MKIRNGFVSNSSSSSFVVLGFKISSQDYYEQFDPHGISYKDSVYLDHKDGYLVGHVFADSGDEALDHHTVDLDAIDKIVTNICQKYNKRKEEIKLYIGTRMC